MLRPAKESDIPSLQAIGKTVGLFDYGFLYQKFVRRNLVFVMELENQIVGYVIAFPLFLGQGFCLQIGVSSKHQGRGVGTTLMSFIEKQMREHHQTYRLFAHTIKDRSLAYFGKKLMYRPWFNLFGLTVIYKKIA